MNVGTPMRSASPSAMRSSSMPPCTCAFRAVSLQMGMLKDGVAKSAQGLNAGSGCKRLPPTEYAGAVKLHLKAFPSDEQVC